MIPNQQHKIILFFLNHPSLFKDLVSSFYPLSQSQLKTYKKVLSWDRISENTNISWSYDILNYFSEDLEWKTLTRNKNVFSDKSLLDQFYRKINWYGSDDSCFDSIVANSGLYWNNEMIERYADKINFKKLSAVTNLDWRETLIDKYINKWDLTEIAHNQSIPWTLRLFEKYLDETYLFYSGVQTNQILVTFNFIEKYKHLLDWEFISSNPNLPWIEKDLLNLWSSKIDWSGVARNSLFFANDRNFYQIHYDKWQPIKDKVWKSFSVNITFPWAKDTIEYHVHDIDWRSLCSNPGIVWNVEMIENCKSYIDWNQLCSNEKITWNEKLIDTYADYIKWGGYKECELLDERGNLLSSNGGECYEQGLLDNNSIPWSIDILTRYEKSIDPKAICNNSEIWEKAFKPYVDDEMIKMVLS